MTYHRWKFTDPDGVLSPWIFSINPSRMDSPDPVESINIAPKSPVNGNFDIPQPVKGQEMTWDGVWRTLDEQDAFATYLNNARPIHVTDHYGRVMSVLLTYADTTRAGTRMWPERHKFTVHSTLLAVL